MPSYVVTGGRGIGLALARELSSNADNTVVVLVRNPQRAEVLQTLAKERNNLHVLQADITDVPALKKAAKEVAAITGGTLDILINNAAWMAEGAEHMKNLSEFDGEEDLLVRDLNAAFSTNVIGVIHTINAFLPLLRAGSTKKVVIVSSEMGSAALAVKAKLPIFAPYSISKAAVDMVNAKYAAELGDEDFIFAAVSPGYVKTYEGPIPPQLLPKFEQIAKNFAQYAPKFKAGPSNPQTPEEAVKVLTEIISTLKPEDNGQFIAHRRATDWI